MRSTLTQLAVASVLVLASFITLHAATPQEFTMMTAVPQGIVCNGVTMVPLRPLAEVIGADIDCIGKTIHLQRGTQSFYCSLERASACANDTAVTLPAIPWEREGCAYAPLMPLLKAFSGSARLDAKKSSLTITLPEIASPLVMHLGPDYGFASEYEFDSEMFIVNTDGTGLRRLTYNEDYEGIAPSFSPDGQYITFTRDGSLFLRAVNQPNETCLLQKTDGEYSNPLFFPDGSRILYVKNIEDHDKTTDKLFSIGVDGRDKRLLGLGGSPVISPDGRQIAYVVQPVKDDGQPQLVLMNIDGSHRQSLGYGEEPRFSPDGTKLCFTRPYTLGTKTIWRLVVKVLSGEKAGTLYEARPGKHDIDEYQPCFRHDGRQVICTSYGVASMNDEHGNMFDITLNEKDYQPSYIEDESSVVFLRSKGFGIINLYRVQADGNRPKAITRQQSIEDYTVTPDGKHILFIAAPSMESHDDSLEEGKPVFTEEQAQQYVKDMAPWVEKVAERKFTTLPECKLTTRDELMALNAREYLRESTVQHPEIPLDDAKSSADEEARYDGLATLGQYIPGQNVIYLLPGNLGMLLRSAHLADAQVPVIAKIIIAHELSHALQDQVVGMKQIHDGVKSFDASLAISAFIEGQASLYEKQVAEQTGAKKTMEEFERSSSGGKDRILASLPTDAGKSFIHRSHFLYDDGCKFATWELQQGGNDQLWRIMAAPPQFTSMIYHPDSYQAAQTSLPAYSTALRGVETRLGTGDWQIKNADIGEFTLRTLWLPLEKKCRERCLASCTTAQTLYATDESNQRTVSITVYSLHEPQEVLPFTTAMTQATEGLFKSFGDKAMKFYMAKPVNLPGIKADYARRIAFTVIDGKEKDTVNVIYVVRGTTVLQIVFYSSPVADKQLPGIVNDVFQRLQKAAMPAPQQSAH
ncbi:MAG TPA: stalk domain-containing protein [Armatimonadota bacterium]|nr:stalk domain-containing protein [Armatimonadota bacterium]